MKSKLAIYLAGSIKKAHETTQSFWTDDDLRLLEEHLTDFEVSFLNPALRLDDLSDQKSVFGRDMLQVYCSDVIFVDARDRRGLGVGAEMMWAKMNQIPVVTWAPINSHYHKQATQILGISVENFVHPFVEGLSDKIVENLAEGAAWVREFCLSDSSVVKGRESIESAIKYYQVSQFHKDIPMVRSVSANSILKSRVESFGITL